MYFIVEAAKTKRNDFFRLTLPRLNYHFNIF
jgi:hypothetical protein